jgi:nicotinamide-nucleotide amidase
MRAEVICTGDELLSGVISDTNTADFACILLEAGVEFARSTVVGDGEEEMVAAIGEAAARADLVIISGGLGPTEDDRTIQAVARVAGVPLVLDQEALRRLTERLKRAGRSVAENSAKQAWVPRGARVLQSEVGTAPGCVLRLGGAQVYVVPGVPSEANWFLRHCVLAEQSLTASPEIRTAVIKCLGIPESEVDARLQGLTTHHAGLSVHFRVQFPEIHVKLVARGRQPVSVEHALSLAVADAKARLGSGVFSVDGRTLAALVRDELMQREWTVSSAESCTGGWVMKALTDEPGSSNAFIGGIVAYDNRVKTDLLGVSPAALSRDGAVSSTVAEQMAMGVRDRLQSTWGMGVTGVAGPGGGTPEKPVGLVYVALASHRVVKHKRLTLGGDRARVREATVAHLLHWLLDEIRGTS